MLMKKLKLISTTISYVDNSGNLVNSGTQSSSELSQAVELSRVVELADSDVLVLTDDTATSVK